MHLHYKLSRLENCIYSVFSRLVPVEDPDKSAEDDHGRSEQEAGGAFGHDDLPADTSVNGG